MRSTRFYPLFILSLFFHFASSDGKKCCVETPGKSIPTGGIAPLSLKYSHNGKCLAVVNNGNTNNFGDITVFMVNPKTGVLTKVKGPLPDGNFPTKGRPVDLAFSPDDKCLAVCTQQPISGEGGITLFSVNPKTCFLTRVATYDTDNLLASSIDYSPNGGCLAVANAGVAPGVPGDIAIFKTNSKNCRLKKVKGPGTNGNFPTNVTGLSSLKYTPDGRCLIATAELCCAAPSQVLVFCACKKSCRIKKITGPNADGNYDTGTLGAKQLAISPDSNCVAVASLTNEGEISKGAVTIFEILACCNGKKCSLQKVNGPGSNGNFVTPLPAYAVDYSPDGRCLAVATNGLSNTPPSKGNVTIFKNECCCYPASPRTFKACTYPIAVAYSPNGKQLAVANNGSNNITVFKAVD